MAKNYTNESIQTGVFNQLNRSNPFKLMIVVEQEMNPHDSWDHFCNRKTKQNKYLAITSKDILLELLNRHPYHYQI